MSKVQVILAALLCLAASPSNAAPELDPRHVVGDLCAKSEDAIFPSLHVYRLRNGGTIVFVAVAHVIDAKSTEQKENILKSVADGFDQYRPDMVLVEGVSLQSGDDARYAAFVVDAAQKKFVSGDIGENLYAVKMAADRKIKFLGWDMSPHEEYIHGIADGFTIPDVIGAHLLRARQNPFKEVYQAAVQRELNSVPHMRQPDSFDFPGWYRKAYGERFDPTAGTPCGTGIASQIVRDESVRRTLNIVDLLDSYARPGKVVLIEAGGNHWLALRQYLASISVNGR